MRILHALEKNRFDKGSVHQMFQAASGLRERDHEVAIASRPSNVMADRCRDAGIVFHPLPFRHELDLASVRRLRDIIREFQPDVIHVHKGVAHAVALAASWSAPVPVFVVNRGVSFPLSFWSRAKYRTPRVDRIVAVCEDIRRVVVTTGRVDPSRVEVIYAGTDPAEFDPFRWTRSELRREKQIPDDRFLFVQVGIRDWKGWRESIDALAALRAPNAHLALVGCSNGEITQRVIRYATDRGVAERVTPVEVRPDMPRVLAAADCVVDASWAGTGITGTIREAMMMRKPVIATNCGGNAELLSSPGLGVLVPPRDVASLARAMTDVLASPDVAARMGDRAREHVLRYFTREIRIQRLEKLYRAVLRNKNTTPDGGPPHAPGRPLSG